MTNPQVGGRLKNFVDRWSMLTKNPWVLQSVQGHYLEFKLTPPTVPPSRGVSLSANQRDILNQEVHDLIQKRAIEEVDSKGGFYSPLFVVPKKDGGWRPIINLKRLNAYLKVSHFKMESIMSLRDTIYKGDHMMKIDLKDAYLTVPIVKHHRKFLRFQWQGRNYQFKTLPFGLATAPRTFTKLLAPVITELRSRGLRLIIYLDDILLMASSPDILKSHSQMLMQLLQELGFILNLKKCVLQPTQEIEFLGFLVNSNTLSISLPEDKILKVQKQCRRILNAGKASARELAQLIGLLTSLNPAMMHAPLFYRGLQRMRTSLLTRWNSYDRQADLTTTSKEDLHFWIGRIRSLQGRKIITPPASQVITSDASTRGWGASCSDSQTGGPWTLTEARDHINVLELRAAFLALKTFASNLSNQHILLLIDNTTAVSYINRKGGTTSKTLSDLAIQTWLWCMERNLTIHAEHIPGVLNVRADAESRNLHHSSDWRLDPDVFRKLTSKWGSCTIDLFAARHNTQLSRFYSFRPDPEAEAFDALAQNWKGEKPYAFPPFILIGRFLQKLKQDRVKEAILIAPVWPHQVWYPQLIDCLIDHPLILQSDRPLLTNPMGHPHQMITQGCLHLAAFLVSGLNTEKSQRKLSKSFPQHGERGQKSLTPPLGRSGWSGVPDVKQILFLPL